MDAVATSGHFLAQLALAPGHSCFADGIYVQYLRLRGVGGGEGKDLRRPNRSAARQTIVQNLGTKRYNSGSRRHYLAPDNEMGFTTCGYTGLFQLGSEETRGSTEA